LSPAADWSAADALAFFDFFFVFLVVSELESLEPVCALAIAGEIEMVNARLSASAHSVSLNLG
jgi:hypothetical protein